MSELTSPAPLQRQTAPVFAPPHPQKAARKRSWARIAGLLVRQHANSTVAFYVLVAAMLIPLWSVPRFPSQDGPMHTYNAIVYRDYDRPDRAIFREFFVPNTNPAIPNWLCPHLLPYMMRVMSPQTAEKLLLTAYLLLLPLSMRYALGAIRPRAASLAIVALPMVPNYHYHMGFQDFCISLAGFFVIAGYWLRRRRNFGWRHGAIMTLMLLGLYFIHAVSTIEVLMLLGIISITWYGRGNWERFAREKRIAPEISARVWRVAPLALAMLPVSILILTFIYYHGGNGAALRGGDPLPWNPWPRGWAHRLYHVASWLKGYRYIGLVPAAIWLLLIGAGTLWLLCWRLRGGRAHLWRYTIWGLGGLLSAALAAAVLFLVARDSGAGGALLLTRLPCYV
ncbi:MAG TPA: hypothetical protein VH518_06320, partial [Tepidisphaeraceae bacterium]